MPKATSRQPSIEDRPLHGLVGIIKPSGPTSMDLLDQLKPLLASSSLFYAPNENMDTKSQRRLKPWERAMIKKCGRLPPKLGQGGTLDPLAEGVLVVGVGNATKHLQKFLDCTKEYETTGLLGTATTSYDSKEPIMRRAPVSHVTEELVRSKLPMFTGPVQQLPPLFSALRMDGKRLFEYAREGLPLPRPIEPRNVTVESLTLTAWYPPDAHTYQPPTTEVPEEERALVGQVRRLAGSDDRGLDTMRAEDDASSSTSVDHTITTPPTDEADVAPPAFSLAMTVSSGTYVRSIVHDLGTACGSAAHVVRLVRTRQGDFALGTDTTPGNCIPWAVFERGLAELKSASLDSRDASGLREWERMLLQYIQPV
ncbi:pseudouridine synthase [Malassezia pachydermatis]|uniref:tRNA pseudouridine(55) synthase n=1 Tax=Malassezia pachydermatis TaxID=77020 RepID=A0A0M8MJQ9_9BASI|nr:pseudouridine synthase [Malassezia pachydermatis]KOS13866.1 pseudouridine synthase [Malassezia pachydermatis]